MSLLKTTRGKFAAVAVAAGLALGGAMAATPAFASPEDPVKAAGLTIDGNATHYDTAYDPSLFPTITVDGITATFAGTGEPGLTVRVVYTSDFTGEFETLPNWNHVYAVVDANGNWEVEAPIGNGPFAADIGQYDLA